MTMSCLITGAAGQVGKALQEVGITLNIATSFFDKQQLDITQSDDVTKVMQSVAPNVVINAAAFTDVDGAESKPEIAFSVNRDGAGNLARACRSLGIPLIHISTDFVFDGTDDKFYSEDDPISPLSIYGQSKAEGEIAIRDHLTEHLIVRTSWVFSAHGSNFVKSIIRLAGQQKDLRIVNDQIGGPTPAQDIAKALFALAQRATKSSSKSDISWGTYHFSGSPPVSRCDFAAEIVTQCRESLDHDVSVTPITTSDYPTPAHRPAHAVLNCSLILETFGIKQPEWRVGLEDVCRALQNK